jgi:hypothetical protein
VGILRGRISSCYSTGSVSGGESVGGFVGYNGGGMIVNCYSEDTVWGYEYVGGFVGHRGDFSVISNCYSVGSVSGWEFIGGLIGYFSGGALTNSFWDKQTSGQASSAGGTGKTTSEMQDPNTFLDAGWDFIGEVNNGVDDIWTLCESPDYPRLSWECPPPVEAQVQIRPKTLNLASKGKWIMCLIRLAQDYNVADIDPNSILLEEKIEAERVWLGDEFAVAKFRREAVQEILAELETPAEVELVVSGELGDGTIFEGTDTISVIDVGGSKNNDPPGKAVRQVNTNRK